MEELLLVRQDACYALGLIILKGSNPFFSAKKSKCLYFYINKVWISWKNNIYVYMCMYI